MELQVDEIGPALRYATATVNKVRRNGPAPSNMPVDDPWVSEPVAAGAGAEPPF